MGSVKIKPTREIKIRLGVENGGRVQKFTTYTCVKHMEKYVPKDTEGLREIVSIQTTHATYMSPHAHYQYKGKLYVDPVTKKGAFYNENFGFWSRRDIKKVKTNKKLRYHTAGTGPYWDRKMVSAEIKDVCDEVEKYIATGGSK